ncbi:conserved hypothetical protein, partial [Ricinus communis]
FVHRRIIQCPLWEKAGGRFGSTREVRRPMRAGRSSSARGFPGSATTGHSVAAPPLSTILRGVRSAAVGEPVSGWQSMGRTPHSRVQANRKGDRRRTQGFDLTPLHVPLIHTATKKEK